MDSPKQPKRLDPADAAFLDLSTQEKREDLQTSISLLTAGGICSGAGLVASFWIFASGSSWTAGVILVIVALPLFFGVYGYQETIRRIHLAWWPEDGDLLISGAPPDFIDHVRQGKAEDRTTAPKAPLPGTFGLDVNDRDRVTEYSKLRQERSQ